MSTLPKEVSERFDEKFPAPLNTIHQKVANDRVVLKDEVVDERENIKSFLASELEQRDKRAAEIVRALGHNILCASEEDDVEPPNKCDCWLGKTIQAILNPQ